MHLSFSDMFRYFSVELEQKQKSAFKKIAKQISKRLKILKFYFD